MTLTFRDVKGSNLTAPEFDGNTRDLDGRITAQAALIVANPPIDHFEVVGTDFYVHFADSDVLGPYPLPVVEPNPRGTWLPATTYLRFDWVTFEGALYQVIFNHVSEAEFDPDANDGLGNDFYRLLIPASSASVPGVIETLFSEVMASSGLANKYVRCLNETGTLVTIPKDSTVNHDIATEIHFRDCTLLGRVSFQPEDVTVTLNWPDGFDLISHGRGAVIAWKKIGPNEWDGFGLFALDSSS